MCGLVECFVLVAVYRANRQWRWKKGKKNDTRIKRQGCEKKRKRWKERVHRNHSVYSSCSKNDLNFQNKTRYEPNSSDEDNQCPRCNEKLTDLCNEMRSNEKERHMPTEKNARLCTKKKRTENLSTGKWNRMNKKVTRAK